MTDIEKNYTEEIHRQILSIFEADNQETTRHESTESLVFEYSRNSSPHILKITIPSHRSEDTLLGEIELLDYLHENGVGVCRAVPSKNGRMVEAIRSGDSEYLAFSFTKAPGQPAEKFTNKEELVSLMGAAMGRLHALVGNFKFSHRERERKQWDEWGMIRDWKGILPERDGEIGTKLESLLEKLCALPRKNNSYGITHADLHIDNFHISEGRIYIYDFEHCEYGYFINDIAIALYYSTSIFEGTSGWECAKKFLSIFLKSYCKENAFDKSWLEHLPDFLKLRKIILYLDVCAIPGMDQTYRGFMEIARKHIMDNAVSLGGGAVVQNFNPDEISLPLQTRVNENNDR